MGGEGARACVWVRARVCEGERQGAPCNTCDSDDDDEERVSRIVLYPSDALMKKTKREKNECLEGDFNVNATGT